MGLLTQIWFWAAVVGVIYAAFLGFTSYFEADFERLQYRNNDSRRERLEVAVSFIVVIITTIGNDGQLIRAAVRSIPADTDIGWLPFVLGMSIFMAFVAYSCLLFAVDYLAKRLRLQLFANRLSSSAAKQAEYDLRRKERERDYENPFWLYEQSKQR